MKKILVGILALTLVAGCTTSSSSSSSSASSSVEKPMPVMIAGEDYDEYGGADAYVDSGNHPTSMYWGNPDFYRMTSTESLTIIPEFQTFYKQRNGLVAQRLLLRFLKTLELKGTPNGILPSALIVVSTKTRPMLYRGPPIIFMNMGPMLADSIGFSKVFGALKLSKRTIVKPMKRVTSSKKMMVIPPSMLVT